MVHTAPPSVHLSSSPHKKSPSKTGGARLPPLLSSSSRLSVHPRQQPRQDFQVEAKHTWFGTGLPRWCQWRCGASGHWATWPPWSTLSTRAPWARGGGGVVSGPLSQQRRERCQKLIIHAGYGREIESAAGSTTGLSEQEGAKALKLELLAESGLLSGMI